MQTEVVVIGGGATGTGILRDLAMRGFQSILVEKRDLTHGTTGRFHGLLHSGGRYAVKDPSAARECITENQILRKIMPHCIEDTGGYFVQTPGDDPTYADKFVAGCQAAGIPVENVPISKMLKREPLLNPEISRCFRVPDGAADGFSAAHANIAAAQEYGAQVLTYHEVTSLLTTSNAATRVLGVVCHDLVHDEQVELHADLVINAAGAWVGKIGVSAGVEIAIRPGKGTMIAVNHRVVNTVINRLKMPSDGDILVPAHTVAVMGTTDEQVPDPDVFSIEPWEVERMLTEGEKIIPGFNQMRMLRAWAGVRPLYQETRTDQSRDITRSYVLLDHEERDGVQGLITITSGKWTTYRKMAEETVDKVCQKLGTQRACRTHLEELPDATHQSPAHHGIAHTLGDRLREIEATQTFKNVICECELATADDIHHAITMGRAKTLDDIRRDVRLGMGPCQGGFCTFRALGIIHKHGQKPDQSTNTHFSSEISDLNTSLRDFLQERWKGLLPILWGQQLRQECLNELIYLNVLNVDHLPGAFASRLGSENYAPPEGIPVVPEPIPFQLQTSPQPPKTPSAPVRTTSDAIIVGAGLAGLTAAWRLVAQGQKIKVLAKGWGSTHWGSGCIDLIGYYPVGNKQPVDSPIAALARIALDQPDHPYAKLDINQIDAALKAFQALCASAGYPLQGSINENWLLPSAVGAVRPTCLAPETFSAGDLRDPSPMLIVGIDGYMDFYPHLIAANLRAQNIPASAVTISIPELQTRNRIDTMVLAKLFDDHDFAVEVARAVRPHLGDETRVGFPAVLGLSPNLDTIKIIEGHLDRRIFEIPGLPPSIPGLRLHQILWNEIQNLGGQIFQGLEVVRMLPEPYLSDVSSPKSEKHRIKTIFTESASRQTPHSAESYILATGGILGGGITTDHQGRIIDTTSQKVIAPVADRLTWFQREFLHSDGHPILKFGLNVDSDFCTTNENLYAIGNALAGDFLRERSLEGVSIATGYTVGEALQ